jgi:hypothetical protein
MLHLHRLLNATGFTAIIGDVTLVYSRGSEACVVYTPDRPRDPDWLFYPVGQQGHRGPRRRRARPTPRARRTGGRVTCLRA